MIWVLSKASGWRWPGVAVWRPTSRVEHVEDLEAGVSDISINSDGEDDCGEEGGKTLLQDAVTGKTHQ